MNKRIMCFGDSLTWGFRATESGALVERYAKELRWTGVLARVLGNSFEVLEEGLCGRTTNIDDPLDNRLNGAAYLPSTLASHLPLDLVVIMLGTNDTKVYFKRSAFEISVAISKLVDIAFKSTGGTGAVYPPPRVLLMAPPPLATNIPNPWVADLFNGAREKTLALSQHLQNLSSLLEIPFFDAGQVISTEGLDGIHFSEKNNQMLGKELADYLRSGKFLNFSR
jgi:lysophospholipase L1-like esterase